MSRQRDFESLRHWIAEENALSSIDIVFFLLVPVTLYLLGQGAAVAVDPWSVIAALLVFPGGLVSLPIGIYAKLVDSVRGRIVAWTVYILISSWGFIFACLWYVAFKLLHGFPTEPSFSINAGFNYLMLGTVWSGVALSSLWLRWTVRLFLRRVRSRTTEIRTTFDVRGLRNMWLSILRRYDYVGPIQVSARRAKTRRDRMGLGNGRERAERKLKPRYSAKAPHKASKIQVLLLSPTE